ncbi:MAG TPA: hypothetical protein VGZ91_08625 [Candidatus Sulfotelmatobacter sp.]|nr:hypothetical protein [Candidatus Sulfotelmatobacter sp.]
MCSRFAFALLFSGVLAAIGPAQQVTSDVVVQGASVNDGYGGWPTCGVDGQVYRHPSGGDLTSVMRVSPDGSTLLFRLPEHVNPGVIAPAGTGLNILGRYSRADARVRFQMYHFDRQANLLAQNQVTIPIQPSGMAVLPSERTILAGTHSNDPANQDEWKYGFAILDEKDKLLRSIDLPLPPGGAGWTFGSRMAVGDGVAFMMLHSNQPPQTAIAAISEKGDLDIKVIAAPLDTEIRHHNEWVFGPGVAVDLYIYRNERSHVTDRFDEYDLKTGEKIATKSAPPTGFQFGCYMGDEVSMLAHSAHVDPARHLSWDTLRMVTSKLK